MPTQVPRDGVTSAGLWEVMGRQESSFIPAWVTRRPYRTTNALNTFRELNSWLGKSVFLMQLGPGHKDYNYTPRP